MMAGRTRKSAAARDIVIRDYGRVVLLEALTSRAHEWLASYAQKDAQWCGEALAVEPRYVGPIIDAAQFDGLVVVRQEGTTSAR
jgi:hypothetical protein